MPEPTTHYVKFSAAVAKRWRKLFGGLGRRRQPSRKSASSLMAFEALNDCEIFLDEAGISFVTMGEPWSYAISAQIPEGTSLGAEFVVEAEIEVGELGVLLADSEGRRLQEIRLGPRAPKGTLGGPGLTEFILQTDLNSFDDFRPRMGKQPQSIVVRNCSPEGPSKVRGLRCMLRDRSIREDLTQVQISLPLHIERPDPCPDQHLSSEAAVDALGVVRRKSMAPSEAPVGLVESIPYFVEVHELALLAQLLAKVPPSKPLRLVSVGAGYGEWLSTAWRLRSPLPVGQLLGIEADASRAEWCAEHCEANSIPSEQFRILHAAIGPTTGNVAYIPATDNPSSTFGAAVSYEVPNLGGYSEVSVISMSDIPTIEGGIDILQMDIQGAEADALTGEFLSGAGMSLGSLIISTHSQEGHVAIEERLIDAGYTLKASRPIGTLFRVGRPNAPDLYSAAVDGLLVACSQAFR